MSGSVIEDVLGQTARREPETVADYLEHRGPRTYETEHRITLDDGTSRTALGSFQMDALVKPRYREEVGVEAKQFVTDGLELVKGCPTQGVGQAVRYAHHCDEAELWHFYVVPFHIGSLEQDCALSLMAHCHERVQSWLEPHPEVSVHSVALRHQRREVQYLATLGESVVGEPSSEPDDLKASGVPPQLQSIPSHPDT